MQLVFTVVVFFVFKSHRKKENKETSGSPGKQFQLLSFLLSFLFAFFIFQSCVIIVNILAEERTLNNCPWYSITTGEARSLASSVGFMLRLVEFYQKLLKTYSFRFLKAVVGGRFYLPTPLENQHSVII